MADFLKLVGERIRIIRKAKGLTQEKLAEKAGLQYSYIGGLERGERNASLETMEKIINGLDVTPLELFKIEDTDTYKDLIDKKRNLETINNLLIDRNETEIKGIQKIIIEVLNITDSKKVT